MSSIPFPDNKLPGDSQVAIAISVILPFCSSTCVLLALYVQKVKNHKVTVDTKIIIAALIVAIGLAILTIYGALAGGVGWPENMQAQVAEKTAQIRFGHQILWGTSIQLVRVGLLLLYWRLFAINGFRLAIMIMIAISMVFYVTYMAIMTALHIIEPSFRGNGIDFPAWLIAIATISLTLDIITLCFPLFVIKNLMITRKKKIYLIGIFGLGVFCIISSIVRMSYFVKLRSSVQNQKPGSKTVFHITLWSLIEPFTSIIAACLPTCATLLKDHKASAPGKMLRSVASGFKSTGKADTLRSNSGEMPMPDYPPPPPSKDLYDTPPMTHSYQGGYAHPGSQARF